MIHSMMKHIHIHNNKSNNSILNTIFCLILCALFIIILIIIYLLVIHIWMNFIILWISFWFHVDYPKFCYLLLVYYEIYWFILPCRINVQDYGFITILYKIVQYSSYLNSYLNSNSSKIIIHIWIIIISMIFISHFTIE
jgi:hypothetical protein